MATAYSSLLGLALPVQGELSGTWGDTVNAYITNYLDAAVAGTQTLSTDADVTLTKATGTALNGTSAQYAIINCTGARTALRAINAPSTSKTYVVINATTGGFGVKLVGAGPTTGVTVAAGTRAILVWNGSDFVRAAASAGANSDITSLSGLTTALSVLQGGTGATTAAAAPFALKGANSDITSLSGLTTALSVLQGGTGATTAAAAPFALKGANSDITSLSGLTTPLSVAQGGTGTAAGATAKIQTIGASVAASALTITAGVLVLDFRSTALTSGAVTTVTGTPANLVVPSTATLGTVSAQQSRLVVLALNNAGTIELAVVNISGGNDLTETGVISTTAISVTADVANVIYSTTARTNVAYRVLGYVESTQATAGTWATAPSTIQGYGGQALAAISSLGYGADVDVTGSRALNTVHYNTTGRPKKVSGWVTNSTAGVIEFQVNGLAQWRLTAATAAPEMPFFAIVQPGKSYQLNSSGSVSLTKWVEST